MKKQDPPVSIPSDEDSAPIMMKMPGELTFTKNGQWKHDGELVTHSAISRYFSSHLTYSSAHKSWIVEVDGKCVPAIVEDTPQVVTSIDLQADNTRMTLSNGESYPLDLSSIFTSREKVWYCRDSSGQALRILRNVVQSLMPYVEQDGRDFVLKIHGVNFKITHES